ncbi:hypothetical protein SAMN04489740_2537 [Arthrobacter alpinus]|uniref:Uncharacterized protein n=1 Tax=Arthrobacter alpinus TaxID=656366 RepID=A0A1H5LNV8_9MICC|nr:hypothetical protein [Arthrobacter alpinus]SEE78699.1 hypothetical protein SAMN04489740_2537 [Arthrobacter alpinus]
MKTDVKKVATPWIIVVILAIVTLALGLVAGYAADEVAGSPIGSAELNPLLSASVWIFLAATLLALVWAIYKTIQFASKKPANGS